MLNIYIETLLKNKSDVEKKTILENLTPFAKNYPIKYISKWFDLLYNIIYMLRKQNEFICSECINEK